VKLQDKEQALARDCGNSAHAERDPASIGAIVRTAVNWFSGIDI